MKHTVDSLQTLDSLSELALRWYHPQFTQQEHNLQNFTASFSSLVSALQNRNRSDETEPLNCSSIAQLSPFAESLCEDGRISKCLSVDDMLELVPDATKSLNEVLTRVCPLLLLQLHSSACVNNVPQPKTKLRPSSSAVWGYGLLFVTVISCCSLVGVVILPLLSKTIYHTVLMLFEGLAVGSLAGSSLFHLIPQTFQLIGQDAEHGYLWKSLIIFGGIYLFYLSERFMKIITDVRKRKKKKQSTYDVCENSTELLKSLPDLSNGVNGNATVTLKIGDSEKENLTNGTLHMFSPENGNIGNGHYFPNKNGHVEDTYEISKETEVSHSHHHHEHSKPFEQGRSAIGTVAWMIIFGDGLHNFIDGLSIGAAFSESILAGVSISVAVVCEEFPHELGDFAVLLSAGMTMRQALMYNFLSAITCYAGLVFGILLGDLAEGAPYIFALAAGMFLYIALVDMMGELGEALDEALSLIHI